MGAFSAPLLVISGAALYFLGAFLPFALVYFPRCIRSRFLMMCFYGRSWTNALNSVEARLGGVTDQRLGSLLMRLEGAAEWTGPMLWSKVKYHDNPFIGQDKTY